MNSSRIVGTLGVFFAVTFGCTSASVSTSVPNLEGFPIVVTDSEGINVEFDEPPERIVSIDSDSVEILFAIGEGHRIVATHDFVSYPSEADRIPRVGSGFALNLEKIVELDPDLVYLFFDRFKPELEALGLKVLYINSLNRDIPEVMDHIRLWGRITGNTESANQQVARFEERLVVVQRKLEVIERGPRVYHHTYEFWAPGADTLVGRIYSFLRADLITAEQSGWKQISQELVVAKDPQIIVAGEFSFDEIKDSVILKTTTAVTENKVVLPIRGSLSIAGPRLIDAIEELAEVLYPELFP
jgi:iron complex transport system substrate-binding protein